MNGYNIVGYNIISHNSKLLMVLLEL